MPSTVLNLRGVEDRVEVYRDEFGIPHARANNVHDAFFAQGFVHAEGRLWRMDYDRRRALGRSAEFVGLPGAAADVFARKARLRESALADHAALGPEAAGMLEAYAAGVNAFMAAAEEPSLEYRLLGVEPEPWEPWHSCAVIKVLHVLMGTWEPKLWRARLREVLTPRLAAAMIGEGQEPDVLVVPPGAEWRPSDDSAPDLAGGMDALLALGGEEGGSNNWAVHGSRTASGKPIVAGDPHRALEVPNCYHQDHLACPEFDAIGLSFAGVPGYTHFGHNRSVAWCVTHAFADTQDFFVERFRAGPPLRYEHGAEWLEADVRRETVTVRGGPDVEVEVVATRHGPVVVGDPRQGSGLALRFTALAEPDSGFESVLPMLRAGTVAELDESMRAWVDPCNNVVTADVDGNIAYLTRGRVPVRSMANAWLPVPGWTGAHEWSGRVPFEEMPRLRNPPDGLIVTANNRIVGDEYPHYIGIDYRPPARAKRIHRRLADLRAATIDDMVAVHADRVSLPADLFVEALAGFTPADATTALALETLRQWDRAMDATSAGAAVYAALRGTVSMLLEDQAGLSRVDGRGLEDGPPNPSLALRTTMLLPALLRERDVTLLDEGETWDRLMAKAFEAAVAWLSDELGPDPTAWAWGRLHRTGSRHPLAPTFPEQAAILDPPSVATGGDRDTVQAAASVAARDFRIGVASVARYAFDLADWDESRWIVPLGASGHPGDPHFADQAERWAAVQMVPMTYSWDRIAASGSCAVLTPAPDDD